MAVYSFITEEGEAVEKEMRISVYSKLEQDDEGFYTVDGERMKRDLAADYKSDGERRVGTMPQNWPMTSWSFGVKPGMINKARKRSEELGTPLRFVMSGPDKGKCIFESRDHRKAVLKSHGYHDNDGGYGD